MRAANSSHNDAERSPKVVIKRRRFRVADLGLVDVTTPGTVRWTRQATSAAVSASAIAPRRVSDDKLHRDMARCDLREELPGFAVGYWLRAPQGDVLRAVQIYDSEHTAQGIADQVRSEGPGQGAPVSLESVETYEVLAHA